MARNQPIYSNNAILRLHRSVCGYGYAVTPVARQQVQQRQQRARRQPGIGFSQSSLRPAGVLANSSGQSQLHTTCATRYHRHQHHQQTSFVRHASSTSSALAIGKDVDPAHFPAIMQPYMVMPDLGILESEPEPEFPQTAPLSSTPECNLGGTSHPERRKYVVQCYQQIKDACQAHDFRHAADLFASTTRTLIDTGSPSDWELVRLLHRDVTAARCLPLALITSLRQKLVEHMMSQSPPRLDAVLILIDADRLNQHGSPSSLSTYLQLFCQKHPLHTHYWQTLHLLRATRLHNHPTDINLMLPYLRTAFAAGETEPLAYRLPTIMREFDLSPTPGVLHQLVQGYSQNFRGLGRQDWESVESLLRYSHHLQYSRLHAQAHAALVLTAVTAYAVNARPVQVYDYLTFCLRETGLVPGGELLRWVCLYFIKVNKFDLYIQWMDLMISNFPKHHPIQTDDAFAHDLAMHWSSNETTCVDIRATTRLLAYNAPRNPFSQIYRLLAYDALIADLTRRCSVFNSQTCMNATLQTAGLPQNIDQVFKAVENVLHQAVPRKFSDLKSNLELRLLNEQLSAARDCVSLLSDFNTYIATTKTAMQDDPRSEKRMPLKRRDPGADHQNWIAMQTLDDSVDKFVQQFPSTATMSSSQRVRAFLIDMIEVYQENRQHLQLSKLLLKLHRSESARAFELFDIRIFNLWLLAAYHSNHWPVIQHALWTLLELPDKTTIPSRFLVLMKCIQKRVSQRRIQDSLTASQVSELEYLSYRLYRRWWQEQKCPSVIQGVYADFASWQKKDEQLQQAIKARLVERQRLKSTRVKPMFRKIELGSRDLALPQSKTQSKITRSNPPPTKRSRAQFLHLLHEGMRSPVAPGSTSTTESRGRSKSDQ